MINLDQLWPIIIPIFAAVLGGCLQWFREHYLDERTLSTNKLLERVEQGRPLGRRGKARLKQYTIEILSTLREQFRSPSSSSKQGIWPKKDEVIFVRSTAIPYSDSECPSGNLNDSTTPIFLSLKSNNTKELIEEIKAIIIQKFGENTISRWLMQNSKFSEEQRPRLWIQAQNILFDSNEDCLNCLQELRSLVRDWLPSAKFVLEIFLADDIIDDIEAAAIRNGPTNSEHVVSEKINSAVYAFERSKAYNTMKNGFVNQRLWLQKQLLPIPPSLLAQRLNKSFNQDEIDLLKWEVISISGSPGVGKTEIAQLILDEIKKRHQAIVLVCSHNLIRDIKSFNKEDSTRNDLFKILTSHFSKQANSEYSLTQIHRKAFADALLKLMQKGNQAIILVADDIDYNKELRDLLTDLWARKWGLKLILIGRTRVEYLQDQNEEGVKFIDLELWNREEAKYILDSWSNNPKYGEQILNTGWLIKEEFFSRYLLDVIHASKGELLNSSRELLAEYNNNRDYQDLWYTLALRGRSQRQCYAIQPKKRKRIGSWT